MNYAQTRAGFTIVELLIVVVVIAILATISIVAYNGVTSRAKISSINSALVQSGKKVSSHYVSNNDTFPTLLSDVGITNSSDTSYQYAVNNVSPIKNYCITATSDATTYHVAGTVSGLNPVTPGPCLGHTGTQAPLRNDCPSGYVTVPGNSLFNTQSFCVMKYEAKNDGSGNAVSVAAGTPWVSISQNSAIAQGVATCTGCHIPTEDEWMTIVNNLASVPSNWSGNAVMSGTLYEGHTDGAPNNRLAASTPDSDYYSGTGDSSGSNPTQRRTLTLSNGEVLWDISGNVREFTQGSLSGNQPGNNSANWRQWPSVATAGLFGAVPYAFPIHGLPALATANTGQNIGQLFSDSSVTAQRSFVRGGAYTDSSNAGIYSLVINMSAGSTSTTLGFRVVKP
ncbi:MAG: prepilin-type N-terminal cleavage/methylation domain-containing protein [Candidatus Microsaccharimonas sp.]